MGVWMSMTSWLVGLWGVVQEMVAGGATVACAGGYREQMFRGCEIGLKRRS